MRRFRRFAAALLQARFAGFESLWAAAFILPAIAFAIAALDTRRVVNAEVRARIARTADMLHEQAASTLEAQEGLLIATLRRISGLDWAAIATSAEVHGFIRAIDERVPGTAALGLVAPDGKLVAASRRPAGVPPVDVSNRDYVVAHREGDHTFLSGDGTYVTSVFVTEPNRMTVVALSRPTVDAAGHPDGGVVTATFVPARFNAFYARVAETARDVVELLRQDGAVLARFPAPAEPVHARLPADHALVRAMANGAEGGLVETRAAGDGADRLYAWRRVGSYPVAVAYGIDKAVIGTEIRKRLAAPGVVAVLGMAVLLLSTARAQRASVRVLAAERARTETEARLRQLERVGAFGELAAGVAHDFRNAAQVMESCARLLHRAAENPARVREHADMVGHAATLIATLTNRMLDIARRRPAGQEPGGFDAYQAVVTLSELLNRTLGGGCRVTPRLMDTGPRIVVADRSEFESALVSLVVNARDAMPEGGEVVLWVGQVPPGAVMPPGLAMPFVAVAVIDQGSGMDEATLVRAGEPFFTTKQSDQATGLGVAGARGFAERAGGHLTLHSRPGAGTVAALWLPARAGEAPGEGEAMTPSPGVA